MEEYVEVVISVICCGMRSWAFDGRSVFNKDELGTRYLIDMSFSVDSCVRKHAKVNGENRQPCFKTVDTTAMFGRVDYGRLLLLSGIGWIWLSVSDAHSQILAASHSLILLKNTVMEGHRALFYIKLRITSVHGNFAV